MESTWRDRIADVPDFPKPGIVFKDITPVLADPQALEELKRVSGLLFSSRCEEAAALLQKVADSHEGKR